MMAQHRFPNYLELRPNLVWCWYIWWFPKVTRLLSYTGCFHSSTFTFSSNIENLALYLCLICLPYLNTISNSCKLNAMIIRAWNGWTPVALTIEYCGGLNALVSQHMRSVREYKNQKHKYKNTKKKKRRKKKYKINVVGWMRSLMSQHMWSVRESHLQK